MSKIEELVKGLLNPDDKKAYAYLKELEEISSHSAQAYPFFDAFADMLDSDNSYVRTRGFLLITANSKWDADNKLEKIIDQYLNCLEDEKPITARQCIQLLPAVVKYKPALRAQIENALYNINPAKYQDSMQALIQKDIQKALASINKT